MARLRQIEVEKDGGNVATDILRFFVGAFPAAALGGFAGRWVADSAGIGWEALSFLLMVAVGASLIKDGAMGKKDSAMIDWLALGMAAEWWQRGGSTAVLAASAALCTVRLVMAYFGRKHCPKIKITAGIAIVMTSVRMFLATHGYM